MAEDYRQNHIISQVFRIGKDPYNTEYCIADNTTISRQHAQITCRDNRWFLKDLNSTNKTYIDDRAIYPNMDVEIYDGLIFVLANESFMFNLY